MKMDLHMCDENFIHSCIKIAVMSHLSSRQPPISTLFPWRE